MWVEDKGREIKRTVGERRQDKRSPLDGMDQEHRAIEIYPKDRLKE